jgi:cellulose 1,4-beta-cellobiosidase
MSKQYNSISDEFCQAQKKAFGDNDNFSKHGGFRKPGATLAKGHVLILDLWPDYDVNMLWLDSVTRTNSNKPGLDRGPCKTSSGVPADVASQNADAPVKYSDIRFGPIDSTYS